MSIAQSYSITVSSIDEDDTADELVLKKRIMQLTEQITYLERKKMSLQQAQKTHVQSQIIKNLNKEVEFHDKVISIIRDKLAPDSDEYIVDQLIAGRKPKRPFLLREDLLEKQKNDKAELEKLKKKIIKAKKARAAITFSDKSTLCNDLVADNLDLEESIRMVVQDGIQKKQQTLQLEEEITKVTFELQQAAAEFLECKNLLEKKKEDIESVNKAKTDFEDLISDLGAIQSDMQSEKIKNSELRSTLESLRLTEDRSKREIKREIEEVKEQIEKQIELNAKNVEEIKLRNKGMELVEESKKKGSSAKIELNKIRNWIFKKEQEIKKTNESRASIVKQKQDVLAEIQKVEVKIQEINSTHQEKLNELEKEFGKLVESKETLTIILANHKSLANLSRKQEIVAMQKLEYYNSSLELIKKRAASLSLLSVGVSTQRQLDVLPPGMQARYTTKIAGLRAENAKLENELADLLISISKKKPDISESVSSKNGSVSYGMENSMISSISSYY